MKTLRKILPALAMLVVSAIMLTTASFAWFAMNATADAKGMNVTLKSNTPFLLISANKTLTEMQQTPDNYTTATADDNNKTGTNVLSPVAHIEGMTTSNIDTASSWYTMRGTDFSTGTGIITGGSGNDGKIAINGTDGYVVKYTYNLCMDKNSPEGQNLKLAAAVSVKDAGADTANGVKPICVIITCGDVMIELEQTDGTGWQDTANTVLASTVPNTGEALAVNVYIYYNGDHADVTSAKQLSGDIGNADVSITFQVDN